MRDTMRRVRAVQQRTAFRPFVVYGPSVTSAAAYATLGDLSLWFDRATLHNYLAGQNPGVAGWGDAGYGSIAWNLAQVRKFGGTKPIVTTETGYQTGPPGVGWIPDYVASIYLPRLLLEQFRMGIERTYIYELCDEGGDTFGLLTSEGMPTPAFAAVKHLLQLLADPGPPIAPRPLRYALTGGPDVRHTCPSRSGMVHRTWRCGSSGPSSMSRRDGSCRLPVKRQDRLLIGDTGPSAASAARHLRVTRTLSVNGYRSAIAIVDETSVYETSVY